MIHRTAPCLRLLALLVLVTGALAAPVAVVRAPLALADEGKDESGQGREDDDKDDERDDEKDEDNGNDDNGNEGNGSEGNGGDDRGNDDEREGQVEQAADYRVEVDCAYDEDADETTCTFTGVAPAEAKDVSHVDLPAEAVCAEVIGGDHEFVDPDPNTRVVGYKSRGSEGTFTLVMSGEVTTGGTATYWFKTGDGVFPATGPGLVCGEVEAEAEAPAQITVTLEEGDEADAAATGIIVVQVFTCAETPASDSAAFDWYGGCEPGGEGVPFSLATPDDATPSAAESEATTDGDGVLRFERLAPGHYDLDAPDSVWCHAESDGVDERGEVVVGAGEETSVWTFFCGAGATK